MSTSAINLENYDLFCKDLEEHAKIQNFCDDVAAEIEDKLGRDSLVRITVEPESGNKSRYVVSLNLDYEGYNFYAQKSGRRIYSILRKLKKNAIHYMQKRVGRRHSKRRRRHLFLQHSFS